MFKNVDSKQNFPAMEEEILKFWEDNQIFRKSVEQRPEDNEFSFYDGPPFATGHPHYGHLVPGTIKDIIPRYKTMKGMRVVRNWGWDCHGLPVENIMRKETGLSTAVEIEKYGIAKYNEECRSLVMRYTSNWEKDIKRTGRWVDFQSGYRTMDLSYMETVWWVFKSLYEKGLVYKGFNVLPYSPGLGCPLSNMEVNLGGYKNVTDQAVTVKFKAKDMNNTYYLAWTTTPWTLPSNLALAFGPDIEYVKIYDKSSQENYILGRSRVSAYYENEEQYEIKEFYTGKDLAGKRYEPLFPYFSDLYEKGAFVTVLGSYVTTEDGCGIVHTAPGFGEDDYNVLKGTGIPVVCPIDEECRFTEEIKEYKGLFVKDADKLIIKRLKEEKKLVKKENYLHSYPFCWRTGTPLIYRAMDCWFVNVSSLREKLLKTNEQINWIPSHLKNGRFGKWLEGARDWAISRNRYWGNPIPVWKCDGSDYIEVIGSVAELEEKCGKKITDLHKHFTDSLTWPSPDGKGTMRRIPDVLDCWFESGSMPYGQLHYPFENKKRFEKIFPADFINEGLDQTRGWFYSLHVLATALFDKPAFFNNVTSGIVLAADGEKMSKTKGNFTDPIIIVNKYGADAMRFALMNSVVVHADDLKFSENSVKEVLKTLIIPLWNAYSFFVTYANLDKYDQSEYSDDFLCKLTNHLDKWMVSVTHSLIKEVDEALSSYNIQSACTSLVTFIDKLNNWYIRRSRRRFWKSESDTDKKMAYNTLYFVLMTFVKLACPIIPFVTEHIYLNLKKDSDKESVHLCFYPQYNQVLRDYSLEKKMALTMHLISMGHALRSSNNIKTRQPLNKVFVIDRNADDRKILQQMKNIIAEELNVKEVHFQEDEASMVIYHSNANFKILGPKLGKYMKEVAEKIKNLKSEVISQILNNKKHCVEYGDNEKIEISKDDILVQREEKENLKILNEGEITVGFDTEITDDLLYEGIARDIIRLVQTRRKEEGFDVSDRIKIFFNAKEDIKKAVMCFKDRIANETLAVCIEEDEKIKIENLSKTNGKTEGKQDEKTDGKTEEKTDEVKDFYFTIEKA